jgi:ferredoxin
MSVNIKLIKGDETLDVAVEEGLRIMDLKHEKQCEKFLEDYECACEGSLACSTCHVILDEASYDKLEPAEDDENDMLDLAYGLTKTSRLGCQIKLTKDLDGMKVKIPLKNRNTAPGSQIKSEDSPTEEHNKKVLFASEEEEEEEKKLASQYEGENELEEIIDDDDENDND